MFTVLILYLCGLRLYLATTVYALARDDMVYILSNKKAERLKKHSAVNTCEYTIFQTGTPVDAAEVVAQVIPRGNITGRFRTQLLGATLGALCLWRGLLARGWLSECSDEPYTTWVRSLH